MQNCIDKSIDKKSIDKIRIGFIIRIVGKSGENGAKSTL
jgi:hypothetical protein